MAMICSTCDADVPDGQVTDSDAGPVHLLDTGPQRHALAVHPVRRAPSTGRVHTAPAPPPAPARAAPAELAPLLRLAAAAAGWVLWVDASKWQGRAFDRTYPWDFAMYRLTLSTTVVDELGAANSAYCHANSGPGRQLAAHGGYHVWYPGNEDQQAVAFFRQARLDDHFVGMIDVESWGGQITGDHSGQLNGLAASFAAALGPQRVLAYGNQPDLAAIWPHRPPWLQVVRAKYSAVPPPAPWLGWQYTDGSDAWPRPTGWPGSSAPFGPADHNAFKGTTADLLNAFGMTGGTGMDDATLTRLIGDAAKAAATLVHQDVSGTMDRMVQVLANTVSLGAHMATVLADVESLPAQFQQILSKAGGGVGGGVDLKAVAAQVAPLLSISAAGPAARSAEQLATSTRELLAHLAETGQARAAAAALAASQPPAGGAG